MTDGLSGSPDLVREKAPRSDLGLHLVSMEETLTDLHVKACAWCRLRFLSYFRRSDDVSVRVGGNVGELHAWGRWLTADNASLAIQ